MWNSKRRSTSERGRDGYKQSFITMPHSNSNSLTLLNKINCLFYNSFFLQMNTVYIFLFATVLCRWPLLVFGPPVTYIIDQRTIKQPSC